MARALSLQSDPRQLFQGHFAQLVRRAWKGYRSAHTFFLRSDQLGYAALWIVAIVVFLFVADSIQARTRSKRPGKPDLSKDEPDRVVDFAKAKNRAQRRDRATPAQGSGITGRAHVVDGDTVIIRKTQIRLFGIDAPESNHPYGIKAKWALVSLCKGQSVRADFIETDHFGRTVARCFLPDGRDLSAEMVKLGLAIDWPKYSGGVYGHLEVPNVREKLWLADAKQKGRMYVLYRYEFEQRTNRDSPS